VSHEEASTKRRVRTRCLWLLGPVALSWFLGCSATSETVLLDQYFAASRLRDRTALSVFALVTFEPQERGIVRGFTVQRRSDERRTPVAARSSSSLGDATLARTIELSLDDPARPPDHQDTRIEVVSKDVTVLATVELPDGRFEEETLQVSMERAVTIDRAGRWVVTGVR
jgi:hypothetical protein